MLLVSLIYRDVITVIREDAVFILSPVVRAIVHQAIGENGRAAQIRWMNAGRCSALICWGRRGPGCAVTSKGSFCWLRDRCPVLSCKHQGDIAHWENDKEQQSSSENAEEDGSLSPGANTSAA